MNYISQPKVSIIIPVFNGANFLKSAIESALAQTYKNIEIIVINDGSNDNGATEEIALSFGANIKYYSKPNGGVASALNAGISLMKGDYFSWLSHDDLYINNKIELQVNALRHETCQKVILYSDYSVFTNDPSDDVICQMKGVPPSSFRYWLTIENKLHGCTLLIPKAAFNDCGKFNESLLVTQDYDLWFRMSIQYDFVHIPVKLVKSRSHNEQGSIKLKKFFINECNKLLINFAQNLKPAEIQQSTNSSAGLGYAQIAASMWYRGFFPAGNKAALLAFKNIIHSPLHEILFALLVLVKGGCMYQIVKPIRRLIPPYLRLIIRRSLNAIVSVFYKSKGPTINKEAYSALEVMSLQDKFTTIYHDNMFQGRKSRSGEGSDLDQTAIIRNEIPKLIDEFKICSFLDAPCGDWYWMSQTNLNVPEYIGVDIVEDLIKKNQREHGADKINFHYRNLVTDPLPKADLIFSRDCLVHLSFDNALQIIKNFKASGAKYLLTTTFTRRDLNVDLGEGFWRTLNLQLAPFNFPPPLKLINEGCTEGDNLFTDKCLGLWKLDDILMNK